MNDADVDLIILRGCCHALHVHPSDGVCPDLSGIANGNGTILEKVNELGDGIVENARQRRRPA